MFALLHEAAGQSQSSLWSVYAPEPWSFDPPGWFEMGLLPETGGVMLRDTSEAASQSLVSRVGKSAVVKFHPDNEDSFWISWISLICGFHKYLGTLASTELLVWMFHSLVSHIHILTMASWWAVFPHRGILGLAVSHALARRVLAGEMQRLKPCSSRWAWPSPWEEHALGIHRPQNKGPTEQTWSGLVLQAKQSQTQLRSAKFQPPGRQVSQRWMLLIVHQWVGGRFVMQHCCGKSWPIHSHSILKLELQSGQKFNQRKSQGWRSS